MAQTQVATNKPKTELDLVRHDLNRMTGQLQAALPKAVPVERFIRVAMTAISNNPDLLKADRRSLYASAMTAAQLGLYTDGFLGEAYLVPYKGQVQMIPGYRGLLKLVRQSGEISSLSAHTVYKQDHFVYEQGDDERIEHRSNLDADPTDADIIYFYAIAKFKDGGIQRKVLSKRKVEEIRKAAPGANSPAWKNHYASMGEKTVLRALTKLLPKSTEAVMAERIADAADAGGMAYVDNGVLHVTDPDPDQGGQGQGQSEPPPVAKGTSRMAAAAAAQGGGQVVDGEAESV